MNQQRSLSRTKSPGPHLRDNRREYTIGILLLLIVVLFWTSSNFLTQGLYDDGYEKPFFITYLSTSAFTFYLVPFIFRATRTTNTMELEQGKRSPRSINSGEYQPLVTENSDSEGYSDEPANDSVWGSSSNCTPSASNHLPLTTQETAWLAFAFCFLWFMANWTVNASLGYTSVASATILTSMSGFFTLGLGRIFGVENFTLIKVLAVCVSFFGITLVSLSDNVATEVPQSGDVTSLMLPLDHRQRPLFGDFLALMSALFYAVYVILLKVRIRYESRIDMQLFFGFVGLFNTLCCWPIGVALHIMGIESFSLPPTDRVWIAILVNMFIVVSSDYLYVIAMLKTSPLVVTVGLSLTIPVAVIGDFLLKRPTTGQVVIGAAMVLISFVALGMDNAEEHGKLEPSPSIVEGRGRSLENRPHVVNDVELMTD